MSIMNKDITVDQQLEIAINEWLLQNKGRAAYVLLCKDALDDSTDCKELLCGNRMTLIQGVSNTVLDADSFLGKVSLYFIKMKGGEQ